MAIDDLLSFEDDDNEIPVSELKPDVSNDNYDYDEDEEEDVLNQIVEVIESAQPEQTTPPVVYDDDEDEDYTPEWDRYEEEMAPTGGMVTVSIDVDPSTVTSSDIPKFGYQILETGLVQLFGEGNVEFIDSAAAAETWDIRFSIDNQSPAFGMLPALQSAGAAMIRARMEDGEIVGDMVPAFTRAEYTY